MSLIMRFFRRKPVTGELDAGWQSNVTALAGTAVDIRQQFGGQSC